MIRRTDGRRTKQLTYHCTGRGMDKPTAELPSPRPLRTFNHSETKPLDSLLEGPIYVSTLDLLFVTDIPYGRICSIDSNANWTLVTEYDGEPNGLVWNHITKNITIIADFKQGILELDPTSRELQIIASRYQGERLKGPNDLVITADGVIYFTDQGMTGLQDPTGRVFRRGFIRRT
ncbi:hypothetical protein F9C07_2101451 [Aspergillus flavus]|uniref:SMP-30/Gluconolactonase/LRE-like region domain-containing protein n=1 Tax=Aspergillus flavus (strain ATCC 200026 / FGSC A1120 / IAM 13836 / NRRL 3357 / JCM 12722 / SRRC 167) TaxID=332952 RepID=A0A7U2QYG4_ASPFN|nr:hypothetical protein F9C07_2101451 [Aspergillus flavus]